MKQPAVESVFYFRKGRMFRLSIGCFMFVALTPLAILLASKSGLAGILFQLVWVTANLRFLGTGFIWTLRSLISPNKPALTISEHGITDFASAFSAGFIPWDAIHSVTVSPVVTLTIKDSTLTLRNIPPIRRWFQATNIACFGGVMFSTTLLSATLSELETAFADGYHR